MAIEHDKAEWNRIAAILATTENVFGGRKKAVQPDDRNPYKQGTGPSTGVPLNRDNIKLLRKLVNR